MQLHRQRPSIVERGARLIAIGNGPPHFIAGFREDTGWQDPLYTDPSLAIYNAASFKRGVLTTLNPSSVVRTIGSLRRGFRQTSTKGDPWQQGGVLIIRPSGDILWRHESAGPGDNASADQIARALAANP